MKPEWWPCSKRSRFCGKMVIIKNYYSQASEDMRTEKLHDSSWYISGMIIWRKMRWDGLCIWYEQGQKKRNTNTDLI